jgi:hypothetical protein
MTDQQINAAIAEACGWRKEDGVYMWTANGIDCTCYELWDWVNDLNAMHEAEKTLDEDQMWRMARNIELNPDRWYFHASARDRAEAFLRTLGKWEVQG